MPFGVLAKKKSPRQKMPEGSFYVFPKGKNNIGLVLNHYFSGSNTFRSYDSHIVHTVSQR